MMETLKKVLGISPEPDYAALYQCGAVIIDVRSRSEFEDGHIRDSINIPINQLNSSFAILENYKKIITCCASGIRSGAAKSILKANGFTEVYNGGGWEKLAFKIRYK